MISPMHERDAHGEDTDRERHPRAVDDAREDVTADAVRAEGMRCRRRLAGSSTSVEVGDREELGHPEVGRERDVSR